MYLGWIAFVTNCNSPFRLQRKVSTVPVPYRILLPFPMLKLDTKEPDPDHVDNRTLLKLFNIFLPSYRKNLSENMHFLLAIFASEIRIRISQSRCNESIELEPAKQLLRVQMTGLKATRRQCCGTGTGTGTGTVTF